MFTGIIQDTGKIKSRSLRGDSIVFNIIPSSKDLLKEVKTGDSISINGACMTVENLSDASFEFTTVKESLEKTNLGSLEINDNVNLESAMTMNSKLDGHMVQGHIDTTGIIKKIELKENSREFYIAFSSTFRDNIIYVGSITINGVSLTIAEIINGGDDEVQIKVAIIPHTYKVTCFNQLKENEKVNIEFDMIGKYVKSILENRIKNY
ncbi:MAG: riboflavin synthase [Bacteroidota bacterium]|nr:riboflavin synthase [Bacteroidota bacterium]